MKNERDETYRLYALQAGDRPSDTEFYFLLPEIDLVYTAEQPEGAIEVRHPEQLPAEAREWLYDAINEIAARYLRENQDALLDGTKTFVERFRVELAREQARAARTVKVKARAREHGQG